MVQEVKLSERVDGATAQQLFKLVYSTPDAIAKFHKQVNKDDNPKVSPWANGVRTVAFNMPMNVPAMLKKVIGGWGWVGARGGALVVRLA